MGLLAFPCKMRANTNSIVISTYVDHLGVYLFAVDRVRTICVSSSRWHETCRGCKIYAALHGILLDAARFLQGEALPDWAVHYLSDCPLRDVLPPAQALALERPLRGLQQALLRPQTTVRPAHHHENAPKPPSNRIDAPLSHVVSFYEPLAL